MDLPSTSSSSSTTTEDLLLLNSTVNLSSSREATKATAGTEEGTKVVEVGTITQEEDEEVRAEVDTKRDEHQVESI